MNSLISRITAFAVEKWQFTVISFVLLATLGVSAWNTIPRSEDPVFPIPNLTVVAVYPGADPQDMERLVAKPIEAKLAELDQLKHITAKVEDGLVVVYAEFHADADAEKKYDEVQREVNALRGTLPADLALLEVRKVTSLDVIITQLALVSETAPYAELDSLAQAVEERLETVPGVRQATRWAAPKKEVRVSLDIGRLAALGLQPGQVLQAVGSESVDLPGGSVDAGRRRYNVKTTGSYGTLDEVRNTVIAGGNGKLVRVRDVADVEWGYGDATHIGRWNGHRAVFVTVTQSAGQVIGKVRDGLWAELDKMEPTLPSGIKLVRGFDQAANVAHRLSRLSEDFAIALGLVLLTLLPLGVRASVIVMISIPLSLAMGVVALSATGFSINQLSIVGFVIALGLLVDDSIVVVENIARFLREGHTRREAAVLATRQIAVAVVGCTATLLFAFLPLLMLPGLSGRYIRSLPVTVVYTVLASLVISLTIIPWLASRLLPEHEAEHGNPVLRALTRGINRTYAPLLHQALAYPRATLAIAVALVIAAGTLVPRVGFSLFPKAETPQVRVDIKAADGSSFDATDQAARWAEKVLAASPVVKTIFTNVGRDNPQMYYNVQPRNENPTVGQLFVLLNGYDPHVTPYVLDTLAARLLKYPSARIELHEFENGPPIDAPIAMRVLGPDLDTLRRVAAKVEAILKATEGTRYVVNPVRLPRTDLALSLDRGKAGLLGVQPADFDRTVRLGVAGLQAGVLRERTGDERPVVVRLPNPGRATPDALNHIWLAGQSGGLTPLSQVATVGFRTSPNEITRYDKTREVLVTANVRTGYNTDRVTKAVLAALDTLPLPTGYRIKPGGELESRQESFGGLGSAIIIATFGILAILVLEFGAFSSTLIVASVIPLGLVGGIVALYLTGNTLSFTAMIGFVALIGIEIKTSILLVDFTDQLRDEGMPLLEAVEHAGEVRFLPILLTTATAIGGLLPIALQGAALYAPLAWVIIGGLVSSTLLSRLVTPVLYVMLAPRREVAPA